MSILVLFIIVLSSVSSFGQIYKDYGLSISKSFKADTPAEYRASLDFCSEVLGDYPDHPVITYLTARLNAQNGNDDRALELLVKATELGYTTKLPSRNPHQLNDTAFSKIRNSEKFKKIISALELAEVPVHNSDVAFILSENGLLPDGITYDPVHNLFYFGSETKKKIISADPNGNCRDFTTEEQDGLGLLVGMEIDPERRTLWVCSYKKGDQALFKYNIDSGSLINKYVLPPDGTARNFNDLTVHQNGDVFISTPFEKAVYTVSHDTDSLKLFFRSDLIVEPGGITLSDNENSIYLADYALGIFKIDISTKSINRVTSGPGFSLYGIDGLYYKDNHLFAVQRGLNQVCRFELNNKGTHINSVFVFERNGPYLYKPTTGVITDNHFYFLADPTGRSEKVAGTIIMKAPLK